MVFGRLAGWALILMAMIMASAEAVMALGTGAYSGLATSDVWTLLVGQTPTFAAATSFTTLATLGAAIMATPAWIVFGMSGIVLAHACRKRMRRRRIFRSA